ncbi:MAG: hypothetical protein JO131_06160 [Gammaproteobacteria bacterium]|nr:hypothetical protein [Gammaproteobacteria bacterium]
MNSSSAEKLEVLLESAQRFKAAVLDSAAKMVDGGLGDTKLRATPREIDHSFNWDEIAKLLSELRNLPENTPVAKSKKSEQLTKLAEIYEVLRAAKMPKLEAVRLALVNEAAQLKEGSAA